MGAVRTSKNLARHLGSEVFRWRVAKDFKIYKDGLGGFESDGTLILIEKS